MIFTQFVTLGPLEVRVSRFIRKLHRWVSIFFTATVAANFTVMAFSAPPMWLVFAPLPPLFALLFSGLYMFVSPHAANWRARGAGA